MKKIIVLFVILFSIPGILKAEKEKVTTNTTYDVPTIENEDLRNMVSSIEVTIDSKDGIMEVTGDVDLDVVIYLYDSNRKEVAKTCFINSTLPLPPTGPYTLYIVGNGWQSEARIEI